MFVAAMLPSASVPSSSSADWTPMASSGVAGAEGDHGDTDNNRRDAQPGSQPGPPRTSSSAPVINAVRPSTIRTHACTRPPAHSRADDLSQGNEAAGEHDLGALPRLAHSQEETKGM